jgi:hypothetical protein
MERRQYCKITGYIFGAREEYHVKPQTLRFEHSYRPIFYPKRSTPLKHFNGMRSEFIVVGNTKIRSSKYEVIEFGRKYEMIRINVLTQHLGTNTKMEAAHISYD